MEARVATWVSAESKSALAAMLGNDAAASAVATADPNTWGYMQLSNGKKLVIGYANLGLLPAIIAIDDELVIGIDELLVRIKKSNFERVFTYRMPTIFHEFVSSSDPIVVRDEVGFVCLSASGEEQWRHLTSGPIEKFAMADGWLRGETIDGEKFSFAIPA